MNTCKDHEYVSVSLNGNENFYCPAQIAGKGILSKDHMDECVETNVVERYAGNIDMCRE